MNSSQLKKLNRILNDKVSGSSELVLKMNRFLMQVCRDKNTLIEAISLAENQLSHFAAVNKYLNSLKGELKKYNGDKLIEKLNEYENKEKQKAEQIYKNLKNEIKYKNSILTISRSGTLLSVFKLWHKENNKLNVIVCESRPALEGRLFAKDLCKAGITCTLITDTMAGLFIPKVDAVIVGADLILKKGNVVNKTGSNALAVLCKEYNKPFYVVTTTDKFSRKNKFRSIKDDTSRVWNYKNKNLLIENIPFEEIDKKYISRIITDE